jgi:hypothetical protein
MEIRNWKLENRNWKVEEGAGNVALTFRPAPQSEKVAAMAQEVSIF